MEYYATLKRKEISSHENPWLLCLKKETNAILLCKKKSQQGSLLLPSNKVKQCKSWTLGDNMLIVANVSLWSGVLTVGQAVHV